MTDAPAQYGMSKEGISTPVSLATSDEDTLSRPTTRGCATRHSSAAHGPLYAAFDLL